MPEMVFIVEEPIELLGPELRHIGAGNLQGFDARILLWIIIDQIKVIFRLIIHPKNDVLEVG